MFTDIQVSVFARYQETIKLKDSRLKHIRERLQYCKKKIKNPVTRGNVKYR